MTEARASGVDDFRVVLFQGFITEAQLLHGSRSEVFYYDVNMLYQLEKNVLAVLRGKIQRNAFLAALRLRK